MAQRRRLHKNQPTRSCPACNLWDAADGVVLRSLLRPGEAKVVAIACPPRHVGSVLAVADAAGSVTLRDLATGATAALVATLEERRRFAHLGQDIALLINPQRLQRHRRA